MYSKYSQSSLVHYRRCRLSNLENDRYKVQVLAIALGLVKSQVYNGYNRSNRLLSLLVAAYSSPL